MTTKAQKTKKPNSLRYELLKDKELRQEFLEEQIKVGLRYQLRTLRDSQDLTQAALAKLIGTKQSVISRLERSPERVSLPTLMQIAAALDVGVVVRFEEIDSIIDWYDNPSTSKMTPRRSEEIMNEAVSVEDVAVVAKKPTQAASKGKDFLSDAVQPPLFPNIPDASPPPIDVQELFNVDFIELETRQPNAPTLKVRSDDATGSYSFSN